MTGPVLKNLIEKFDLQRIFLELAELDFLLQSQTCHLTVAGLFSVAK